MQNSSWIDYLRAMAGDDSYADISRRGGVSPATVTRWFQGKSPDAEQVISLARAYEHPPTDALVAAGYLTPSEAVTLGTPPRPLRIRDFSDLEIARETLRRIESGEHPVLDAPMDADHPVMQERDNVTHLHGNVGGLDEDQLRDRYDGEVAANKDQSADRLDDDQA
ncbi:helix-turn-helix transcriptional regulator [Frigoribacterium sp. CFBP9030]|uniref:helix-turn-helix domain-containing protein n=1 Tax=Frigoribacterium sp. CFBP9030 TaxID=3096537 RepID=UPI002A699E9D|nr:helix-turn-helix transcriptional regulator [Frigoribacterium sp. CFBP9030]MDY0891836.1 helix-turn-helix transcriptional regulator [Frigoribacterium sp. CFBP9030]